VRILDGIEDQIVEGAAYRRRVEFDWRKMVRDIHRNRPLPSLFAEQGGMAGKKLANVHDRLTPDLGALHRSKQVLQVLADTFGNTAAGIRHRRYSMISEEALRSPTSLSNSLKRRTPV
jgi:hypothetical protein